MAELKKSDSVTIKVEESSWTDRRGEVHEGLSIREFIKTLVRSISGESSVEMATRPETRSGIRTV